MDRGTKIYAIILGVLTLSLAVTFLYESPKVGDLNERLELLDEINSFPYHFKVLRISKGVAVMSSPRSTDVPVSRILGILFPRVKGQNTQSPEFQKAQKALAKVQTLARDTIILDAEVNQVKWELDRYWLTQHGIVLNTPSR